MTETTVQDGQSFTVFSYIISTWKEYVDACTMPSLSSKERNWNRVTSKRKRGGETIPSAPLCLYAFPSLQCPRTSFLPHLNSSDYVRVSVLFLILAGHILSPTFDFICLGIRFVLFLCTLDIISQSTAIKTCINGIVIKKKWSLNTSLFHSHSHSTESGIFRSKSLPLCRDLVSDFNSFYFFSTGNSTKHLIYVVNFTCRKWGRNSMDSKEFIDGELLNCTLTIRIRYFIVIKVQKHWKIWLVFHCLPLRVAKSWTSFSLPSNCTYI